MCKEKKVMKRICIFRNSLRRGGVFFIFYFLFSPVGAQTFTQQLQQQKQGEGKITVDQSKEIEQLVNGTAPNQTTATTATKPATATTAATTPSAAKDSVPVTARPIAKPVTGEKPRTNTDDSNTDEPAPVDMSKKVPRHSYKVNGFRVQAFAGGNSRVDRQKAEQAGRDIKMRYPELPVYVHFYSPQWKCRVGNFRTYEEAATVLRQIKAMGYNQACIVKGKITVQY